MTEIEAKKNITAYVYLKCLDMPSDVITALDVARIALEKQIPKKPTYDGDGYAPDGTFVWDEWICPCCGTRYEVDFDEHDFCPNCGQKLDWSDENEID